MKYIFIVQREGRGHLTQCIALEEILRNNGHEVTEILVGQSSVRELPKFFEQQVQALVLRFTSPNFLPSTANKRNKLFRSIIYNIIQSPTYLKQLRKFVLAINTYFYIKIFNYLNIRKQGLGY